jgi:hypothetical protein
MLQGCLTKLTSNFDTDVFYNVGAMMFGFRFLILVLEAP